MTKIEICDTTLRDGEQTPGVHFGIRQKLDIALRLEAMGVDVIEAGFPAASEGDAEAVRRVAGAVKNSIVCGLARCTKSDIDACAAALAHAAHPRTHIFIATSDIHLEHKLHIDRGEALRRIAENTAYAASLFEEVQFSAEDATRTDRDFLVEAVSCAIENGASIINIPDTVGYTTPEEFFAILSRLRHMIPAFDEGRVMLGVHCHNDLGLATANNLSAISAGAMLVVALLLVPQGNSMVSAILLAAVVGGCIGFIPYNFNPAKIFMGDTGSNFLGFILAAISIFGLFKTYAFISFAVPFLVLGLPIFDICFAVIRRVAHGQSPMHADRGHFHHRLIDMGFSQKQTVAIAYLLTAILGLAAVTLTGRRFVQVLIIAGALAVVVVIGLVLVFNRHHHDIEAQHEKEKEQQHEED